MDGYWEQLEYLAEALVTIGVIGEVLAEWHETKNKVAKAFSVVLIAGLMLSLAALKATNEGFNGRIAELNEQAREAQERASAADLKRVELQNRIIDFFGSRQLNSTQSAAIAKGLVGLEGVRVDVFVVDPGNSYTSSDDSISLGRDFVITLRAAKMEANEWLMTSCASGTQAANVSVITLPKSNSRRIALKIRDAFAPDIAMASGVGDAIPYCTEISSLDKNNPHKRWAGANSTTIAIAIGRKTQPILTREMLQPADAN